MSDKAKMTAETGYFGAFDLKWVLIRRILLAALLCVAVGVGIVLNNVAIEARRQTVEVSNTISDVLKLQLVRIDSALDLPQRFPDWTAVLDYTLQPGQCVTLAVSTSKKHSRCIGMDASKPQAPVWFVAFYETVFLRKVDTVETIMHSTAVRGRLKVTANKAGIAFQAWDAVSNMLRLSVALIAIMCLLIYAAVARALKPTNEILSGLSKLTNGDLSIQLPRYRLHELDRISDGLNILADQLRVTTQERSDFARRLIDAQEHERRHIARDLHDEIGQHLTALSGLAALMQSSLDTQEPVSRSEVDDLVSITGSAVQSLRSILAFMRPLEIDHLGLKTSLDGLISDHNRRARGATRYVFEVLGDVDRFDPDTAANIFRIVQEGLNNAARHAGAASVMVKLVSTGIKVQNGSIVQDFHLSVEDDGAGWNLETREALNSGYGLLGMRERVSALGGRLVTGPSMLGGAAVSVQFIVSEPSDRL